LTTLLERAEEESINYESAEHAAIDHLKMVTYTVTTELSTPWWLKLLRFFRIKSKRTDFELCVSKGAFNKNDIITTGRNSTIKILNNGIYKH
jgi:hypothetical protein